MDIHHRRARSLNFLGTALKVIAGTPDFDDGEWSKFIQKEFIESNNEQILINARAQEQINELTGTVIFFFLKHAENTEIYLNEVILSRNRELIIELQNLLLAITLAKINIVNPTILDDTDLR